MSAVSQHPACELALAISDRLADPEMAPISPRAQDWWRQPLAHGIPGIALLHIELAARGLVPWQRAGDWLKAAARCQVTSGPLSNPYYGAPALAHTLATAARHLPGAFTRALDTLDHQLVADACCRLAVASKRIEQRRLPMLAEFDAVRGLTGYGAYLLRRDRADDIVRAILGYLVRLTDPVTADGIGLPGWWTASGPSGRPDSRFPGGHANNGMAHGIAGVLSFLSLAMRRGVIVQGQRDAIRRVCEWLDRWYTDSSSWPYWVTLAELGAGRASLCRATRPSWCYGAAGLARAQQLAGIALQDASRQLMAEDALASALADPDQLAATTDTSLCHGFAGLAHLAARCAADAFPLRGRKLKVLAAVLLEKAVAADVDFEGAASGLLTHASYGPGLLNGAAGIALAVLAPATGLQPYSEWDSCLLIS